MKFFIQIAPLALGAVLFAGCGANDAPTTASTDTTTQTTTQTAPGTATTGNTTAGAATVKRVSTGKPQGSIKVGDKALCAVCVAKEGTKELEPVAATLNYKGKTYAFCSTAEKAEFISAPAKYADAR